MSQVKYGVIITDLKGKQGGTVFQQGNTNKIMRNKGYRSGSISERAELSGNRISYYASYWRTLTQLQRDSWSSQASNWPFVDKFGNTYTGSGFQYFMAFNAANAYLLGAIVEDPVTPTAPTDVLNPVLTVSLTTTMQIDVDVAITAGTQVLVFASAPRSPGRNLNNVPMRYLGNAGSPFGTTIPLNIIYPPQFGSRPLGAAIVIRLDIRHEDWPYTVFRHTFSSIVVAD